MVKMLKTIEFGTLLLFLAISGTLAQGYETYENFGITFEYPSLWSVVESGNYSVGGVTLYSENVSLMIGWNENAAIFDPQAMLSLEVAFFLAGLNQSVPIVDESGVVDGNTAYAKVLSFDLQGTPTKCIFVDFISSKSNRFVTMMFVTPNSASQNIANFGYILDTLRDMEHDVDSSPPLVGEDIDESESAPKKTGCHMEQVCRHRLKYNMWTTHYDWEWGCEPEMVCR